MKIYVTSENPVKIEAVTQAASKLFQDSAIEIIGHQTPSAVPSTPIGDAQTKWGAYSRIASFAHLEPDADFWVSIEAGCVDEKTANGEKRMSVMSWVLVRDKHGNWGESRSASMQLPEVVAEMVRQGKGLGQANDAVFGVENSKQKNGATGLLTENAVCRVDEYIQPVMLAFVPFKNAGMYFKG